MKSISASIAMLVVAMLGQGLFAQCENGQCRTPVRNAVKKTVGYFQTYQPARSTLATLAQVRPLRTAFATVTQSRSLGCTGSAANYGSSGSMSVSCGCGCPNCGCGSQLAQAGEYDEFGDLILSVGPSYVLAPSSDVSSLGIRQRRASREVILEAAQKAHDDCSITSDELRAIKLAAKSPRMLSRMEDLILEKAQSSGAYSFALDANGDVVKAKVDWEAIGDFILKIAPLIFKLIEMFALDTSPDAAVMYASAVSDDLPNFIATRQQNYVLLTAI